MVRLIKRGRQIGVVTVFMVIVYIPFVFTVCSWVSGRMFDISLHGYTDTVERAEFTWKNLCSGEFQEKYANWIDTNVKPRGVMIHLYNTLRYNLFNQASRPIANNGDIISPTYLLEKFCIGTDYDYSIPENKNEMDMFIEELKAIQQKLYQHGKRLFVYIAPSKADWDYESIPSKYVNMKGKDSIRMYDCFKTAISKTDIVYMDCDELYSVLEYPAFYSTGIHWSRTFEQKASAEIIEKLSELTGNKYRKILLGDVQEDTLPFWRDSDVFDLANIWNRRNETYYEYTEVREQSDFNKLRILLYGDSFGEGLCKDVLDRYSFEDIFYINYNNYVRTRYEEKKKINKDWNNMDFAYYLDRSDVVVIEMTKPNIGQYSCGFTTALNSALDSYVAGSTLQKHLIELNPSDETASWNAEDVLGLYGREAGFVWAKKDSQVILDAEAIKNEGGGLEIDYSVPGQLQGQTVIVWVNGRVVAERTYEQGMEDKIVITADQLPDDINDSYEIEIACSNYFVPSLLSESADNRELAICIRYIGEVR